MVRKTSTAANAMNTTCLVGEISMCVPGMYQGPGRCQSPNGRSITWLSAVCSRITLPMSGDCIIAETSSPETRGAAARRPTAGQSGRPHHRLRPAYHRASSPRQRTRLRGRRAIRVLSWSRPLTALYRLLPPFTALTLRVLLHPIVDAHEPREPTDERADDGEQRLCVHPPIEKPATCPKQQDRDREVERQPEVLVALAVALGLGTGVFLRGSHVAPGNLDACEIFRKQTVKKATI